ncbi:hypothetical protein BDP55DRAFT_637736 [Colletotrichum godetiae]|uniref:Uncharacterized protein n=1 Tax=Colletotrichum godetiae TaxID=1209918 RepID=A0AAJ0ENE7_9PEZI|nr:uncharacterized protein BDP55DRAFT_637736 [Colletotrichum godetiae]KAK1658501.1 hypothetical protein BDP55DRAFT_637736 [Colletotrichum godetiae]
MWFVGSLAVTLFKQVSSRSPGQLNSVSLVRALTYLKLLERKNVVISEGLIKAALSVSLKLLGHREETDAIARTVFDCGTRASVSDMCLGDIIWANEVYLMHALDYDLFQDDGWDLCLAYESALDSSVVTDLCLHGIVQLDIDWTATAVVAAIEAWHRSKALLGTQSWDIESARKCAHRSFVQHCVQETTVYELLVAIMLFSSA